MKTFTRMLCILLISLLTFTGSWPVEAGESENEWQIDNIKETYDVEVHYVYKPKENFPPSWLESPNLVRGRQPSLREVERFIPLVDTFLSTYSRTVINKNLKHIYLISEFYLYGKSYGGTYDKSSLYINSKAANKEPSDLFLLSVMHHEFSSILMKNYKFPKEEWLAINLPGFKYSGSGREMLGQPNLYSQSEEWLSNGFLVKYSQSSLENDFNMLAFWLFTRTSQLRELGWEHIKLQRKIDLAIDFYKSIDEGLNFE
jgi:Putative zinc-binding metallo-peptidase